MATNKFTFKTIKPTGKWRSFYPTNHYIKIGRSQCGQIVEPDRSNILKKVTIRFQIIKEDINEDNNPNCKWKWIQLKTQFETVDEAKEWLQREDIFEAINNKFKLWLE